MRYSNVAPSDAVNTSLPSANKSLPTKIGRNICTIEDLLFWLLSGVIKPDPFNRAGIKDGNCFIAEAVDETVRKVRENLLPMSLQDCHATLNGDGTASMTDFHGRGMGLMLRWWDGKMTPEDLKAEACVFIKPGDYHDTDYKTINDHEVHTAKQQIWHPLYAYGSLIHKELLPLLKSDTAEWLLKHRVRGTMLSNIIYALKRGQRKTDEWNLPDVYGMRTEAAKLRTTVTRLKVREKDICDLVEAIDGWYDLTRTLDINAPGVGGIKDVTGNPFFGLYVIDRMSNDSNLNKSNIILSKQIVRNIGELSPLCPQLLAPKKSTVRTNCKEVFRILKKKHRRLN
jgi:hypothetical protein